MKFNIYCMANMFGKNNLGKSLYNSINEEDVEVQLWYFGCFLIITSLDFNYVKPCLDLIQL